MANSIHEEFPFANHLIVPYGFIIITINEIHGPKTKLTYLLTFIVTKSPTPNTDPSLFCSFIYP